MTAENQDTTNEPAAASDISEAIMEEGTIQSLLEGQAENMNIHTSDGMSFATMKEEQIEVVDGQVEAKAYWDDRTGARAFGQVPMVPVDEVLAIPDPSTNSPANDPDDEEGDKQPGAIDGNQNQNQNQPAVSGNDNQQPVGDGPPTKNIYLVISERALYLLGAILCLGLLLFLLILFLKPAADAISRTGDLPCTHPNPNPRPPFSPDLDRDVVSNIKDICSSQSFANTYGLGDPNFDSYSEDQKKQIFWMASVYFAFGGDHWTRNDNWLNYNVSVCEWYTSHPSKDDVCDEDGIVQVLNLTNNNLKGTFPSEVMVYPNVKIADLSHNSLYGTIPPASSGLAAVEVVDFSFNNFTGRHYVEWGVKLTSLRILKLQHNALSGPMPADIAFMQNITYIDISDNQFTGKLPDHVQVLDHVEVVNIGNNGFHGTVSTSFGALTHLKYLEASGNERLRGTIPAEIELLTNLEYLGITDTSLTGSLPSGLCQMEADGDLVLFMEQCVEEGGLICCPRV